MADITPNKDPLVPSHMVEMALAAEREKLNVTLQNIKEGVIIVDAAGVIQRFNMQAEHLTGWPESEAVGKPWPTVLRLVSENENIPLTLTEQSSGTAGHLAAEGALLSRQGVAIMVHVQSIPIHDTHGAFAGAVIVIHDITPGRKLQTDREHLQRMDIMGRVARGIAHEFNNHIMVIGGSLALAKSLLASSASAEISELLAMAETASQRAQSLTQQILTFSKEGTPVKRVMPMKKMIEESVRFMLKGSACTFSITIPDDLWAGNVDAGQVGQVIQNIVINALHTMPRGGTVGVTAENVRIDQAENPLGLACGRYVRISITDTGTGIPQEIIGKLLDPSCAAQDNSIGVGLAAACSIAKQHGGHIAVEPAAGQGSRFDIYLPAAESPAAKTEAAGDGKNPAGGKVLIMDDNKDVQQLLSRMLKHIGYQPAAVCNGSEAVRLYKEAASAGQPFNAVIMDLTIPGQMGARETIVVLRECDPAVKAIITSGRTDDPAMTNWKDFNFAGALGKPFQMRELTDVLRNIIAHKP